MGTWLGGAWAGHTCRVPSWVATFVSAVGIFVTFTPMHDATHGAIVPKSQLLNDGLGLLTSLPFAGMYRTFKLIHLSHHAHLNDPTLDPDHWSGSGPLLLLPLRWLTVFYHYAAFAVGRSMKDERWRRVIAMDLAIIPPAFMTVLWWQWEMSSVHYWLLPFVCSTCYLMYVFDYLPHRPHHSADKFLATSVTTGAPSRFLSILLLSQNMHNVHHLVPTVPFYRYSMVWHTCADELRRCGTRELPWLLWPNREAHLAELRTACKAKGE